MTRFENVGVFIGEKVWVENSLSQRNCMDVCACTGALEHCCRGERLNFIAALSAGSILQAGVVMNCDSCTAVHTILCTL